jgi:hypothetical protein
MWRLKAWPRLIVPPGRTKRRLAALFLVFIFGITYSRFLYRSQGAGSYEPNLLTFEQLMKTGKSKNLLLPGTAVL